MRRPYSRAFALALLMLVASGRSSLCRANEPRPNGLQPGEPAHVGMDAALLCAPYEVDIVMKRAEARNWSGPWISSIEQLPGLLNGEEQ